MESRDIKVLGNMVALSRRGKGAGSRRSMMLRTIMPHLSRETGDQLAEAIGKGDTEKFRRVWDKVKNEISQQIARSHHKAHASNSDEDEEDPVRKENMRAIFGAVERALNQIIGK